MLGEQGPYTRPLARPRAGAQFPRRQARLPQPHQGGDQQARARTGEGACVRPLFAQHPHLPGNLLGGLLLQGGLPPEDPTALERCLWHAAYGFALWRFLLALEPDDEEVALRQRAVTLAYQLARYLFHNRRWLEGLHQHYETAGLCRAPLWFALLR